MIALALASPINTYRLVAGHFASNVWSRWRWSLRRAPEKFELVIVCQRRGRSASNRSRSGLANLDRFGLPLLGGPRRPQRKPRASASSRRSERKWSGAAENKSLERLDRGTHRRNRNAMGGGAQRALRRDRGRVRLAEGRTYHPADPSSKAGDIGHPDRVRDGRATRSATAWSRRWLGRAVPN